GTGSVLAVDAHVLVLHVVGRRQVDVDELRRREVGREREAEEALVARGRTHAVDGRPDGPLVEECAVGRRVGRVDADLGGAGRRADRPAGRLGGGEGGALGGGRGRRGGVAR